MLIGDKQNFAIEMEILDIVDGWIFGTFIFWLANVIVGNPEDKTVDLKGCINWLRDFVENPKNRFEPDLYDMDRNQVFLRLVTSITPGKQDVCFSEEYYEDIYSRFHIEHLGMSSFDGVSIILIENDAKQQRCIWQQGDKEVNEVFLAERRIEELAIKVIDFFETEIRKLN